MNIEVINEVMSNRIKLISCLFKAINCIRVSKDQPSSVIDQVEKMKAVVKVIQSNFENHTVAFSTDEDFKVSYARSPEDVFNSNKRVKVSFEKYVRRQLNNKDLSDNALTVLSNELFAFKEILDADKDIVYYKGKDLVEFYNKLNSSCHSCMTSNCDCFKTTFYALNPEKVSILSYKDTLRALIWTTDSGKKVLDRVYPENHKYIPTLKKWALCNNVDFRKVIDRMCNSGSNVELNSNAQYKITMKPSYVYPYLDTFRNGWVKKDGTIVISNNEHFGNATFVSTDGGYSKTTCCVKCGARDTDFNYVNNEPFCKNCVRIVAKKCQCGYPIDNPNDTICINCYNRNIANLVFNKCDCDDCHSRKTQSERFLTQNKHSEYSDYKTVNDIIKKFIETVLPENNAENLIFANKTKELYKQIKSSSENSQPATVTTETENAQ